MKNKLHKLMVLLLFVIGAQAVNAYGVADLEAAGWTKVESITDVANYYYVFVDAGSSNYAMAHAPESGRGCYKTLADPNSNRGFMWVLESAGDAYSLKNAYTNWYFNSGNAGWNNYMGATNDNANYKFAVTEGKYAITSVTVNQLLGPWNNDGAVAKDGEDVAANKSAAQAPGFYIYSKSKDDILSELSSTLSSTLSSATKANPVDATFHILNPDFSWKSAAGWTLSGSSGNRQYSNATMEAWRNTDFEINQKLSNLPNGIYKVTVDVISGPDNPLAAYLYAKGAREVASEKVSAVASKGDYGTMSNEVKGNTLTVASVMVTDGELTIGVRDPKGWIVLDNFTLSYLGAFEIPDYEDALKAAKEAATKTDKMEATVMPALNAAIATYGEVDVDDQEALGEAIVALATATNNVNASIAAYASAGKYFPKMAAALEGTNVYTKEAYDANYAKWLAEYENNTLATETAAKLTENSAYSSGHKTANYLDDILLSVWSIGGEQAKDYDKGFYVNTWSTEGNNDGSEFFAPFFEYWTGDDNSLGANTIQAKMTGLKAETSYSFTIRGRVRNTNGQTKVAEGITMKVGEGTPVDISAGTQFSTTQFYIGNFTAEGKTDAEGTLTVTITVAENSNISWLSFYNAKYTEGEDLSGYIADYEFVLNNAKAALEKGMDPNLRGDLQAAVDKYGAVDKSDKAALIAAKAALDEAVAAVAASVAELGGSSIKGWTRTGNKANFQVNTWSNEGATDGSGMTTPFIENWQAKENGALANAEMAYTLTDQTPGYYKVTALVRSLNEAGGAAPEGIFIFANEAMERAYTGEACKNGVYDNPVVYGYVGEDGKLTLGVKVIRANVNWISWKNFTVEYVGTELTSEMAANLTEEAPEFTYNLEMKAALESAISALSTLSNDSYTAAGKVIEEAYNALDLNMAELDAAIAKAEEKAAQYTLGFAVGEYAPYTNTSGLAPIAAAKEVRATAASQAEVDKAAADLNAAVETAVWTANTVEMNAIYNGGFAESKANATSGVDVDVPGWSWVEGMRMVVDDAAKYLALAATEGKKALFAWGNTDCVYGEQAGYTISLKAATVYEFSCKYAGWADGEMRGVTLSILNTENEGLAETTAAAPTMKITEEGAFVEYSTTFTTGTAGDYVLRIKSGGHAAFTDFKLFTSKEPGTGIEHSELNTQHSAVIYDLSGRRVEKMDKGIYIVNGKKVVK